MYIIGNHEKETDVMEQKIIELLGSERNIIVLIPSTSVESFFEDSGGFSVFIQNLNFQVLRLRFSVKVNSLICGMGRTIRGKDN